LGADEVATANGYTRPGLALTNVNPANGGTVAFVTFSPNPSWTNATFSTAGCMIYNASTTGGTAGRVCSVHDFGGSQQVSTGTFSILMPSPNSSASILRVA
jgi:hypothetical protein